MLPLLARYAIDRGLDPEPGFADKDVRWAIVCDHTGRYLDVIELGDTTQRMNRGQRFRKCPDLSQNELIAGGRSKSKLLVDTVSVVTLLGVAEDDAKVHAKHAYFVDLLRQTSAAMPELESIADALSANDSLDAMQSRLRQQKAKPADKVTFRVGDHYPVESMAWHDRWREIRSHIADSPGGSPHSRGIKGNRASARCLATGEVVSPAQTHLKILGLSAYGGRSNGDALVSFDKEAFRSYGLEQSANAAVSEKAMCAYRDALNYLIRQSGQGLAGSLVVHWFKTRVDRENDPLYFLVPDDSVQEIDAQRAARRLLEGIKSGQRPMLSENLYYAVTINGAAGRVMVRDWMEGQFTELAANVSRWFEDLSMTDLNGSTGGSPGLERVITCLLPPIKPRQDYGEWVRQIGAERSALWHAAVRGDPIPYGALSRIVVLNTKFHVSGTLDEGSVKAEHLLRTRMGLVRAYHVRRERMRGDSELGDSFRPFLNERHPSPAYQCGRLMAVLAEIQHTGLGEVGADVIQRYYAAASATPALVLGRLCRMSQYHLDKIRSRTMREDLDDLVSGIWSSIRDSVPRALTLEEQSLFAMGYYQQKAAKIGDNRPPTSETEEA
jgi:CRISPR-associated protein Csd1